ncbi:MAG: CBS domain-containing protein [Candidatus Omnitrophota bacterium]|nr:CBS domain-containing protein [Candidatus Omnitrophota bacterium]
MKAKDLMSKSAIVVPLDMLITDLAKLLREKRIGGVPVMNEKEKICGVVTVTDLFRVMDIMRKVGKRRKNWFFNFMSSKKTMLVKDIYTRRLISVVPETSVEDVVNLMIDRKIHTIPVMNKEQTELYGVIGRHDVTAAALGITRAAQKEFASRHH